MIRGIGNDLIEVERVKKACQSEAFLRRVYTARERERFGGRPASLAGNFAVKEAVAKLLGTGFRGFGPAEIEVLRDESGRPFVNLSGRAEELKREQGIETIWVSISHSRKMASAVAVGEGCGAEAAVPAVTRAYPDS